MYIRYTTINRKTAPSQIKIKGITEYIHCNSFIKVDAFYEGAPS